MSAPDESRGSSDSAVSTPVPLSPHNTPDDDDSHASRSSRRVDEDSPNAFLHVRGQTFQQQQQPRSRSLFERTLADVDSQEDDVARSHTEGLGRAPRSRSVPSRDSARRCSSDVVHRLETSAEMQMRSVVQRAHSHTASISEHSNVPELDGEGSRSLSLIEASRTHTIEARSSVVRVSDAPSGAVESRTPAPGSPAVAVGMFEPQGLKYSDASPAASHSERGYVPNVDSVGSHSTSLIDASRTRSTGVSSSVESTSERTSVAVAPSDSAPGLAVASPRETIKTFSRLHSDTLSLSHSENTTNVSETDGDGARCQSLRATATSQQSDTLRSADGETPQATSGTLASSNPVPPGAAHAASEAALVHPHPQSLHHKDSVDVPTGIRDSAPVSTDVRVLSCRIFDPPRNPLD